MDEILQIGVVAAALVIATAYVSTKVIAREWFRAKRQHVQDVMKDCTAEQLTEES